MVRVLRKSKRASATKEAALEARLQAMEARLRALEAKVGGQQCDDMALEEASERAEDTANEEAQGGLPDMDVTEDVEQGVVGETVWDSPALMDLPGMPAVPPRSAFLASAPLHWLDRQKAEGETANAEELQVLRAVRQKRYKDAIQLVESLDVPVCRRLANVGHDGKDGPSLLHISMQSSFESCAVSDVQLLLRVAKLRGEVLCEEDFAAACASGSRQIIVLLRDAGAPWCRDALHHALRGKGHRTGQADITAAAQLLLEARADINGLSETGNSPLTTVILSSRFDHDESLVDWLLQQRADANGSGGSRLPLHSLIAAGRGIVHGPTFAMLLRHRAEVNRKAPLCGSTPLHLAVHPHAFIDLRLARALKALGADCTLRDDKGRTAAEMLFAAGEPEAAAELEGRAMNAAEEEYCRARQHPVARAFERSGFDSVSWTISRPPSEDARIYDEGEDSEEEQEQARAFLEERLSSLLGGHNPQTVVLTVPLTRDEELKEHVELSAPRAEGFLAKELLEGIYNFFQEPLSTGQFSRIQKYHDTGCITDLGNVQLPDEDCTEREHKKRRAVRRIELRVGGNFFEGFEECAYFEEQRKLTGKMCLGS